MLDIAAALVIGSGGTLHDLDTVHRFTDAAYGDLTLQLRDGRDPSDLFDRLNGLGLIQLHTGDDEAHERMAAAVADETAAAVTVATNDKARDLNARIRNRRGASGDVDDTATIAGSDGLPIGAGDVIATRKNDSTLGVANRQTWTVQHVATDGTLSVVDAGKARKHQRSLTLPASYVAEHVHLAYAATGYGVQGITTTTAHTFLSESLDGSGVFVGMTRGRYANVLHVVADSLDHARDQFIDSMQRDRADRGLQAATTDARVAVTGLAADGPVKIVNDERARLTELIAQAEREAAQWERGATLLADQARVHAQECVTARDALRQAEAQLAAVRNEALAPLLAQALADGRSYIDADAREHEAWKAMQAAGRLAKRGAERTHDAARADASAAREALFDRWGSIPDTGRWALKTRDSLEPWAERVATTCADESAHVQDARQATSGTTDALHRVMNRHGREAHELTVAVYGPRDAASARKASGPNSAQGRAERWIQRSESFRDYLTRIESLPVGRAVSLIERRRAVEEQSALYKRTRAPLAPAERNPVIRDTADPTLQL